MLSITEENYIKHILGHLLEAGFQGGVGTNELAASLQVKPSSANVMLKRLREKGLINYEKYGKIFLSEEGRRVGMEIIRKHRLWETFLYEKLDFTWDEVHEVAEQLEHIQSKKLVEKLDKFLGYPSVDPHGDPIPNSEGEIRIEPKLLLSDIAEGQTCRMVAVNDNSAAFLKYVQKLGLAINHEIRILSRLSFDDSLEIEVQGESARVSKKFAQNIYVVSDKNR